MAEVPKRKPDFEQFRNVLLRIRRPDHLPFYEHVASPGFIARRTHTAFDTMGYDDPDYWKIYVDFWLGMGYDGIPMEIPLKCPVAHSDWQGGTTQASEAHAVIRNRHDFERYPWPDLSSPIDFRHFETVASLIPDGVKIVGGVCGGPYEWVSQMMGVMGLSYALFDDPSLVGDMFLRIGSLHASAAAQLVTMDGMGALRQGDDLGYKTSTFLKPDLLRRFVFPIYKRLAESAHLQNMPFILHSCGNLDAVYDDLIDFCRIDAKHSFEDTILPVEDFKAKYGAKVTALGGLDVDTICRSDEKTLRAYARKKISRCFGDGFWALGTGNSLTDYMPVENYLVVLEEGLRAC
jgi:uroporphyrinogen decarboxylase